MVRAADDDRNPVQLRNPWDVPALLRRSLYHAEVQNAQSKC